MESRPLTWCPDIQAPPRPGSARRPFKPGAYWVVVRAGFSKSFLLLTFLTETGGIGLDLVEATGQSSGGGTMRRGARTVIGVVAFLAVGLVEVPAQAAGVILYRFTGIVADPLSHPLANADVSDGSQHVSTDVTGR